ncbi:MAG: hypothetical protein JO092_07690, partial [Candidatus Eremiobacteraeota bacterium]|nr:hypothetical protein [Candidatus Eremiobacteraeota bacterium]
RVDSHPAFSAQRAGLELADDAVLRPNQLAEVDALLVNSGSDVAHNVRLRLYVSPEARLEAVEGATREKSSLLFGDVLPGASAKARLGLRLLRSLAKEYPVTVDAVLTADAMLPVPLARLIVATAAEPDFSVGTFASEPADTADVGESVAWVLHVRNGGDGAARRVAITIAQPETLIYVPNSTTVNDVPVRDIGAQAPFASAAGIVLNDVDPGVEAAIRWNDVVHNGLAAGEAIVRVAEIRYDGERNDEIISTELKVRASPAFANAIPGLPFGLDGMIGPAFGAGQRAITQERFLQLPPALPVGEGNGQTIAYAVALERGDEPPADGHTDLGVIEGTLLANRTGTAVSFSADRLARASRLLEEARFGGLVTHLFALRALLPDAIGDAHGGGLGALKELLREELDRLFIKLRLPSYVIAPRDIETPSLRTTIERVLTDAASARGIPPEAPGAALFLRGSFDPSEVRELADRCEEAELASALPWSALARLLPDGSAALLGYRAALVDYLDALAPLESSEFIDALQRKRDAGLDGALDSVRASLLVGVQS